MFAADVHCTDTPAQGKTEKDNRLSCQLYPFTVRLREGENFVVIGGGGSSEPLSQTRPRFIQ